MALSVPRPATSVIVAERAAEPGPEVMTPPSDAHGVKPPPLSSAYCRSPTGPRWKTVTCPAPRDAADGLSSTTCPFAPGTAASMASTPSTLPTKLRIPTPFADPKVPARRVDAVQRAGRRLDGSRALKESPG